MRLDDVKNAYEALSGTASQIIRQLSLAGIGLIWLFNVGTGAKPALPHALLQGALFIFLALFLICCNTWWERLPGLFISAKRSAPERPRTRNFWRPPGSTGPTWFLFSVKAACMLVAYLGFILPFLFATFSAA